MKLIKKPIYQKKLESFRNGGLIKLQQGGVPSYFKQYGMDSKKFTSMFSALRQRGLSNQVAFEITWQSMKEQPKRYYSFGTSFNDVNSWADNVVNHQLKRNIYKGAVNAKNFEEYRRATMSYNRRPEYTDQLRTGRDQGKSFINDYIKQNNLGEPVVMNTIEPEDNQYYA